MNATGGGNGFGRKTASAGTRIRRLVPGTVGYFTRLVKLVYTAGVTAHTVTVLRPIGRTTTTSATAATGTVVNMAAELGPSGNALATNDLLAVRETDGVTRPYVVSSVSALAVTLTSGLTAGVPAGGKVWNFGVPGDTDPKTGEAHPAFGGTASQTTTYVDSDVGLVAGFVKDDPLLVDSDNATNAGVLEQTSYAYTSS